VRKQDKSVFASQRLLLISTLLMHLYIVQGSYRQQQTAAVPLVSALRVENISQSTSQREQPSTCRLAAEPTTG
jgi:hypothetical protein